MLLPQRRIFTMNPQMPPWKDGTINKKIRKAVLQVGAPALLAFMASNAFLAINHLKQMQKIAALRLESSMIQTDISAVLRDLTDMEAGQRGYLLTGDASYLQPYTDAKNRIANGHWSRSSSLWLAQSKRRWSALSICANRGIATAHSCWWIRTKVWRTWIKLAGFCLRCPWQRAAASQDWTKRGMRD